MGERVSVFADQVSFNYADKNWVLRDLSVGLTSGEVQYIVGPSGSGKTTFALLVAGVLTPQHGEISRTPDSRSAVVLQFPEQLFLCDSISDEWRMLDERERVTASNALHGFGLALDTESDRSPHDLSFAERRLLAIAMLSASETATLILDEPTLGLDETHLGQFVDWLLAIANGGRLCLVITHDEDLIKRCPGNVSILNDRKVVWQGPSSDFLIDEKLRMQAGFV